jgi:hypothetical protein
VHARLRPVGMLAAQTRRLHCELVRAGLFIQLERLTLPIPTEQGN